MNDVLIFVLSLSQWSWWCDFIIFNILSFLEIIPFCFSLIIDFFIVILFFTDFVVVLMVGGYVGLFEGYFGCAILFSFLEADVVFDEEL